MGIEIHYTFFSSGKQHKKEDHGPARHGAAGLFVVFLA